MRKDGSGEPSYGYAHNLRNRYIRPGLSDKSDFVLISGNSRLIGTPINRKHGSRFANGLRITRRSYEALRQVVGWNLGPRWVGLAWRCARVSPEGHIAFIKGRTAYLRGISDLLAVSASAMAASSMPSFDNAATAGQDYATGQDHATDDNSTVFHARFLVGRRVQGKYGTVEFGVFRHGDWRRCHG